MYLYYHTNFPNLNIVICVENSIVGPIYKGVIFGRKRPYTRRKKLPLNRSPFKILHP